MSGAELFNHSCNGCFGMEHDERFQKIPLGDNEVRIFEIFKVNFKEDTREIVGYVKSNNVANMVLKELNSNIPRRERNNIEYRVIVRILNFL